MEQPDVYNLVRIRWQVFGTLTFRSERLPEKVRASMWFSHCRKTCENFGLYFPNSVWCLRQESGEATGRRHFHYLLGGLPENSVTIATCFDAMYRWQRFVPQCLAHDSVFCRKCEGLRGEKHWREIANKVKNVGGGMARVRIFNRALNGVGYLKDCLSGSAAADQYELCKYGLDTSEIVWSKGALACLTREINKGHSNIERHVKRAEKSHKAESVTPQVNSSVSVTRRSFCDLAAAEHYPVVKSTRIINGEDSASWDGQLADFSE